MCVEFHAILGGVNYANVSNGSLSLSFATIKNKKPICRLFRARVEVAPRQFDSICLVPIAA